MKNNSFKKFWHDWLWPLLFAVVVVKFIINPFLLEAYEVPTGSMEKTILPGDRLFAEKFTYGLHIPFTDKTILPMTSPRPGQMVIFRSPYDGLTLVKRCIGLPGDTIEVKNKDLYLNGKKMEQPFIQHTDPEQYPFPQAAINPLMMQNDWESGRNAERYWVRDNFGPVVVPPDCYFMMGDNRDESFDSRYWGPLPKKNIRGRVMFIYWSWDKQSDTPLSRFWQRFRITRIGKILA
ncbi:MAG: signal peptidase I [Candidatus Edwardsbacteria bacterium]|nr:signal peptidase I [Candidatus Edwardsbacteria bacterium]